MDKRDRLELIDYDQLTITDDPDSKAWKRSQAMVCVCDTDLQSLEIILGKFQNENHPSRSHDLRAY